MRAVAAPTEVHRIEVDQTGAGPAAAGAAEATTVQPIEAPAAPKAWVVARSKDARQFARC